jgi:hypothetical protein
MPKPLSNFELGFLRDIRNGLYVPGPDGKINLPSVQRKAANLFLKERLINESFGMTDRGLDALESHFILDPDEPRPRWELVFEKYIVEFKTEGLLKLREDLLHDVNMESGEPRIGAGSFEACPLSYKNGKKGSFEPDTHLVEHTENAFVTYWDELGDRSADSVESSATKWRNEERAMKMMVKFVEQELTRRKIRFEDNAS